MENFVSRVLLVQKTRVDAVEVCAIPEERHSRFCIRYLMARVRLGPLGRCPRS